MKPESASYDSWKELYGVAKEVIASAPWAFMEEDDVFAVQLGPDAETYFACILGSAGISQDIVFYRGKAGWAAFNLIRNDLPDKGEAFQVLDAIAMGCEPWNNISPEDKKRLKRFGFGPGLGALPVPVVYRPGRMPRPPDAGEVDILIPLLRLSLKVFHRVRRDPLWIHKGRSANTLFNVLPGGDSENPAGDWLPPPVLETESYRAGPQDQFHLGRLARQRLKPCAPWEIQAGDAGAAVKDDEGAFRPLVAIFADATTGYVTGVALSPASELAETLPQKVLSAMEKHQVCPTAFHIQRDDITAWLEPVAKHLRIPMVRVKALPMADEAMNALREEMERPQAQRKSGKPRKSHHNG